MKTKRNISIKRKSLGQVARAAWYKYTMTHPDASFKTMTDVMAAAVAREYRKRKACSKTDGKRPVSNMKCEPMRVAIP